VRKDLKMPTEIRLPELGENIESAQVVKILVSVGDTIEPDRSVVELETDKAVIEVPASIRGTVKEIHVKAGQEVKVGQLILTMEAAPEGKEEAKPEPERQVEAEREAVEGEPADQEEVVEPAEPVEKRRNGKEALTKIEDRAPPAPEGPSEAPGVIAPAAPSVRRLARELGVDINQVPGSGPAGRISMEDVKNYVRQLNMEAGRAGPGKGEAPTLPLPDFTQWGEVEREPMSNVRRTTARRLSQAWSTIPHVTNFDQADVTELEQLRKQHAKKAEAAGGKLTVTAIILKVVASALKVFPKFNASLDMANQEIIYKKYYHLGVAVDTDRGLLVPVIRDVDRKNIIQLSVDLTQISEKARDRKVAPEDLEGGTFTITNLGGIGGTNFAPIINPPDVAILGIARASIEPVFRDGQFEPRLMLPLSLSYDHRLIDGADAARFLRWVAQVLEQPFLLALEG
jgi:pyruvate dehydrogenase E2 component (dihydrolipoamide acetyltransferase)